MCSGFFSAIRASLWKISGCRQRFFHLCFSYQVSGFTSLLGFPLVNSFTAVVVLPSTWGTRQASRVWRTSEDHQRPGSGSPSRHLIIGKSVSCSSGLWPLSGRHLFRLCMKKHSSEHRVQNNIFFMGLLVYLKLQRFFLARTSQSLLQKDFHGDR